jgi:DNA-binding transcriptional ArsR family regulator
MGNPDLRPKDTSEGRAKSLRASLPEPAELARLARQAQVLSDPTRLALLLLLREAGELCVSDLCLIIEREQGGVSRHLKIAFDAGLVSKRRFDLWVYYELTGEGKRLLAALLDGAHSPAPSPKK